MESMVSKFLKLCAVFDIYPISSFGATNHVTLRKDGLGKVVTINYSNLITDDDVIKTLDNVVSSFKQCEYFTMMLDKPIIKKY